MKTITIVGPPGSGKTTLTSSLADKIQFKPLFCGDIYRHAKSNNTPNYQELNQYEEMGGITYKKGLNNFIIKELNEKISSNDLVIIEGFKDNNFIPFINNVRDIDLVIILNGPIDVLVSRILERKSDRNEDNINDANRRINNYNRFEKRIFKVIDQNNVNFMMFDVSERNLNQIQDEIINYINKNI